MKNTEVNVRDEINTKLSQAKGLIAECEALADASDIGFSWDLAYGMGGWYESGEWNASSESC